MIEDFTPLEQQLRALRPPTPSPALERRLAEALREPSPRARSWWEWLGFHHAMAAFGWGLVVPSAAAVMAVTLFHLAVVTPGPSDANRPAPREAPTARETPTVYPAKPAAGVAGAADGSEDVQDGNASTVLYETSDEGIVLTGTRQPARRIRYRSEDTLQWRNPRTGASIQVSYPREEVVLTPISAE